MSRFEMSIDKPGDIVFELRAKLTLAEWNEIEQQIDKDAMFGPARWLRDAIKEMLRKANADYRAFPEETPN